MKDGIIKGTGDSRYLKGAGWPATYAEFKSIAEDGTLPFDLNGINEAGWQVIGTLLSKANLLSDATAAKYFSSGDHTVDDVLGVLGGDTIASGATVAKAGAMLYGRELQQTGTALTNWFSPKTTMPTSDPDLSTVLDGVYYCATYASSVVSVYKSVDGSTWESVATTGLSLTGLSRFFAMNGALYACYARTIYQSTDDGATWALFSTITTSSSESVGIVRECDGKIFAGITRNSTDNYYSALAIVDPSGAVTKKTYVFNTSGESYPNGRSVDIISVALYNGEYYITTNVSSSKYRTCSYNPSTNTSSVIDTTDSDNHRTIFSHNGQLYNLYNRSAIYSGVAHASSNLIKSFSTGFTGGVCLSVIGSYCYVMGVSSASSAPWVIMRSTDLVTWETITTDYPTTIAINTSFAILSNGTSYLYRGRYSSDTYAVSPTIKDINNLPIVLPSAQMDAVVKTAIGSYTGAGAYGTSNANTLSAPGKPIMAVINNRASAYYLCVAIYGVTTVMYPISSSSTATSTFTWGPNGFSWYSTASAAAQMNASGTVYDYIIFYDGGVNQ